MARRLAFLVALLALSVPAAAGSKSSAISGFVRNSGGTPQMGAAVELLVNGAAEAFTVYTDERGFYNAENLPSGRYQVKVSAPSFLPTMRENVAVRNGARVIVNLTLNTLFEALQLLPSRRQGSEDEDDWRWTLRSTASRPILRVHDNTPVIVFTDDSGKPDGERLRASMAFFAGSQAEGFGGASDVATVFKFERSLFSTGMVSVNGNVGYSGGAPASVVRASFSQRMDNGSRPEIALTVRRFGSEDSFLREAALQALALQVSDTYNFFNFAEVHVGGEFQTIQFLGRVTALRPFGDVDFHLTPNTVLTYGYATSQPNTRLAKGFDSAPADLSESGPRFTLVGGNPVLERARHQEFALSQRVNRNRLQVAYYRDSIHNVALSGLGLASARSGFLLPDIYSGTFNFNGGDLETSGMRAVAERKFAPYLTGTIVYAYGGVLEAPAANTPISAIRGTLAVAKRHSLALKTSGQLPGSNTRLIASYKWVDGSGLTPVDIFDSSAGQTDPYLNLFLRQPLPQSRFLPGKVEALIDMRNLLAQGYVPVIGPDGSTLYLVQSARSLRGGLAIIF